jgi:hypothetical protein
MYGDGERNSSNIELTDRSMALFVNDAWLYVEHIINNGSSSHGITLREEPR